MKYLTVIRHAKSSWDNPVLDDIDRPLNARGKRALGLISAFLLQKGLYPDRILCSPARRARKTAEGIARGLDLPKSVLAVEPRIYSGDAAELLRRVCGLDDTLRDVFLVGHEPVLSGLIGRLGGHVPEKFPTGAMYRYAFDTDQWEKANAKNGSCEFFVYPKMLGGE